MRGQTSAINISKSCWSLLPCFQTICSKKTSEMCTRIRHWPPKPGIVGSSPIWGDWEQSGAAEACWAHNPEVDRSKLSSAICVLPGSFAPLWVSPLQLIPDTSSQTPQYPTVTLMTHIIAGCNYDLNLTIAIHTLTQGTTYTNEPLGVSTTYPLIPTILNTKTHRC